jgi:Flp pilus assembly protein TadG
MKKLWSEEGQATVLAAVFMVILVGMTGFVVDVGSWFRQQRVSQATVDAAALAAAQKLPFDSTAARALATQYADDNGGSAGMTVDIGRKFNPDDQVTVSQSGTGQGFFSRVLGIQTVTVRAKATAVAALPTEVWGAAPIAVNITHQMLSGPGCPCFGIPTTIPLGKNGAPGSFAMINLDNADTTGTTGSSTLAAWIGNGYQDYLDLGVYFNDSGAKFSDNKVQDALYGKYGSDLLFPIYDSLLGTGSNAEYHVIGWASFHLTLAQVAGNEGSLNGYFDKVIWQGIVPPDPTVESSLRNFGVYSVALID